MLRVCLAQRRAILGWNLYIQRICALLLKGMAVSLWNHATKLTVTPTEGTS